MALEASTSFESKPERRREITATLLYLVALLIGSMAAMTEILPHRSAIGEFSNSGRVGIAWSSLLFILSGVAFLRTRWATWWGKALFLLLLLFWCGFLISEITGYAFSSSLRELP